MLEERPTTVTVVNDLDGIDAGSYCVWTPQHKKKTSASKRWKFRNLLPRSHRGDGRKWGSFADNGGAAAKFVGFFSNGNGLGRSNLRPRTK
uniref:Uncharacterized protein n=2 Tax=Cajanus cajan TaxID=3821 RepID=A0A151S814_CAJCA|nr:hypothetical protein KK1_027160 [Cajanus cajan]